jgi:hypothetical protein
MDWWEPVLNWQLVTFTAIFTILVSFPMIMERGPTLWRNVPELKMGAFWVLGASLSLMPIFWIGGMRQVFEEMGKIYVYYFLLFLFCSNREGYRAILWTVLGCTIWMAIHAVIQMQTGYGFGNLRPMWRVRDRETGEGVWQARAFGTFDDPNDLCLIMIISIPLLYAEFRTLRHPLLKGIALLAIPLTGYAAWLTNSRGGYLGIFAMVSAYVIGRTKGFKRWVLLAGSIFFLTTVAPSRFSAGLVGQQDRAILWGDGIAMFKANPFFGVGFYDFQKYSSERKVAHNTYVHVLAETGLVGYLPFFGMIYFAAVHLRRTMNRSQLLTKEDNIQLGGLFSAAVGYLTSIYFLSRHKVHISYIIFALMAVKTIGVCEARGLFQEIFVQNAKAYRWWVYCALGSIVVMWVTIRVVNALG